MSRFECAVSMSACAPPDRAAREASAAYQADAEAWVARRESEEALALERQRVAAREASQRKLRKQQAERVAEVRGNDKAAATEAKEADKVRRNFTRKWESRANTMQLPAALRAFGIDVEGGGGAGPSGVHEKPTAAALRKAYRQAVLRFHPDRQSAASSVRERVEAEEKFKIITRKMDEW
eukprot:CAMPEP_0197584562 /NCGR_PEP_ID=MMETSP1326-20131121/7143_1 /TAXON_ID=1155430 /ORGANISM="Genus nov. species nov., Strain RCC2288" /LENGTH=179 /DNA_ID=CAMNT_0043148949 /DNA_START=52 /DNA_END=591 /DNA_ORIENTATION=+